MRLADATAVVMGDGHILVEANTPRPLLVLARTQRGSVVDVVFTSRETRYVSRMDVYENVITVIEDDCEGWCPQFMNGMNLARALAGAIE